MNKLISILLLLTFGFVAQAEGQTLSKRQTDLIETQVDSMFQEMIVFAEKLEFNKLSLGVNDTHRAGFITNSKYYAHYSTLLDEIKINAQGISRQDISIEEKKITVLSDKIVLMTVAGLAKAHINDGREIAANFYWSFVYEKFDNNWKVIHSHQSIAI